MFRKLSGGNYGHRSSQPLRVSEVHLEIVEEKKVELKKSLIPTFRPSTRSVSVDDGRLSQRASSADGRRPGDQKGMRASSADGRRTGEQKGPRATSTERPTDAGSRGVTPASKQKSSHTPGTVMTTIRRTARKDTRILSDKAFQNSELCKVRDYLLSQGTLEKSEIEDIGSRMTLKLFVKIMNILLKEYFPVVNITMSNYVEAITSLMKKLKYPGKVARSWLVSANTVHSWQHVLGVMSWLVNLLLVNEIQWCADDDLILSTEKIEKMQNFNGRRFREFDANLTGAISEEDELFFEELVGDTRAYFEEEKQELEEVIEKLEVDLNDPERLAEMDLLQGKREELSKKIYEMKNAEEVNKRLRSEFEEVKSGAELLERKLVGLEEELRKTELMKDCKESREELERMNMKLKTEIAHSKNVVKMRAEQEDELTKASYSSEVGMAKARKKLDKEILVREALVRELICLQPDAQMLEWSIFYSRENAQQVMKDYKKLLESTLEAEVEKLREKQKKLVEKQKSMDMIIEKIEKAKEMEEKRRSEACAAEERVKQLQEAIERRGKELEEEEVDLNSALEALVTEIATENDKIEDVQEIIAHLEKEIAELTKDCEEAKEKYDKDLQFVTEKAEQIMRDVMATYQKMQAELRDRDSCSD